MNQPLSSDKREGTEDDISNAKGTHQIRSSEAHPQTGLARVYPPCLHHSSSHSDPTLHFNRDSANGNFYKKSVLCSNKESKLLWTHCLLQFSQTHISKSEVGYSPPENTEHGIQCHEPGNIRSSWEFDTS